jgi:hypothetical protein
MVVPPEVFDSPTCNTNDDVYIWRVSFQGTNWVRCGLDQIYSNLIRLKTFKKIAECIVELEKVTSLNLPLSCLCFIDIYLYVVLDVLCCCWIVLIECLCLYCILVSSTSTSRIWNLKLEKQVAYSRIRTQGYNTTIGVLAEWISYCTKILQ